MRRVRLVVVTVVALGLGACDWGPRGPGQLRGVVTSPAGPVGALVLEIRGPGIQGFSESGQTRVFSAQRGDELYRVVLVAADPDRIRFRVDMDDVRSPALTVVAVEAVDESNVPITDLTGISVELRR